MGSILQIIAENIKMLRIRDLFDIAIVAFAIYKCVKLVKETRAAQLIKGLIILVVVTQLAGWIQLNATSYILANTMQVGLFAIVVVFQPELRRVLEKVGSNTFKGMFTGEYEAKSITPKVCEAVEYMSEHKIGALILMERNTKLGDVMISGTEINADVSAQLLINIFMSNTPLHDGATIIGDNKIKASACFLPLTQKNIFSKELGTRHRAAIGISEITDCMAVVVSEETGKISVAKNGEITRGLTVQKLGELMDEIMLDSNPESKNKEKKIIKWVVKK